MEPSPSSTLALKRIQRDNSRIATNSEIVSQAREGNDLESQEEIEGCQVSYGSMEKKADESCNLKEENMDVNQYIHQSTQLSPLCP